MKKTTKKLDIKKETVSAFTTLSAQEIIVVNGGRDSAVGIVSSCIPTDCNDTSWGNTYQQF